MKRLQFLPIILLAGSLGVLLVMVLVRVIGTQREVAGVRKTQTAIIEQATDTPLPSNTPLPTETATPTESPPTATVTPFPTETPKPGDLVEEGCNVAEFVTDVTIPDKTVIDADHKFTKTWRLLNAGTCTWTTQYRLVYHSGTKMAGPDKANAIILPVEPGKTIDISVELRAPAMANTYKGFWVLEDQYGNQFGLGPNSTPFYVEIVVVE
jgi:hypothetical protein